jgi:hypothetical protein
LPFDLATIRVTEKTVIGTYQQPDQDAQRAALEQL